MSLCRVNTVQHARKPQGKCQKCGTAIEVGDPYRWWKGRYTGKYLRCMASACYPQAYERETNPLRADHMRADDLVSSARMLADQPAQALNELIEARDLVQGIVDELDNRLSGWAGTGLENGQQYEACDNSKAELEDWVNMVEGVLSDLEGVDNSVDADLDDDDRELREQEIEAEVESYLNDVEELPELDLGA